MAQPPKPQRRILSWLSDVCHDARTEAGLTIEDVASRGGLGYSKLYRFETEATRWPTAKDGGIDKVIGAYALATGIGDPRLIWLRAIQRWLEHGPSLTVQEGELREIDGEVPPEVLRLVLRAADAFAREHQQAATPSAPASPADGTRRASGGRGRP